MMLIDQNVRYLACMHEANISPLTRWCIIAYDRTTERWALRSILPSDTVYVENDNVREYFALNPVQTMYILHESGSVFHMPGPNITGVIEQTNYV